ncbi:hypothetical protein PFICI_11653 [Pestalotiopsis fici W106-1]|uniref:Uncharacterized protein n=1 Tax=Pestalotiopsis fici (strain W106-1 / CGMCC3.15140) TaxID=1229662 RepID=W3WTW1_PESFW|nr:uncharacterized protein PFICI_11653 [Pestalotiopsis fici W106-1]ETS76266.1 hypothetical protein PFICI_11653 [Pestalotiopsis fici W106-1]
MRLLQLDSNGQYSLTADLPCKDIPPYAILSHTWGSEEVVFTDLSKPPHDWQNKSGFDKIRFCAEQAKRDGLQYFWVDTCCIDKSDSIVVQTAINSMFRWYRDAERCYVYLSDVSNTETSTLPHESQALEKSFRDSKWFSRGWTLQELVAPKTVVFYSKEGIRLGDKRSLEFLIRDITGIPANALRGTPLSDFTVSDREVWARNRQTTLEEDMAYCLLGIFDVFMPLIYGEGRERAQQRLREETRKVIQGNPTSNFSVSFSLSEVPETQQFVARKEELAEMRRALSSDGSRRIVSLHGLGGIGKTQLTVAYAKQYRDEYSAIFWFNIKDETSIRQSFAKVAKQILQQHPDASHLGSLDLERNDSEIVEAVKAWLSLPNNTRWLVVYDNYDNPKLPNSTDTTGIDIRRFFPVAYQGSIVITTRLSQVDIGYRIRIKKLEDMDDSLMILLATSGRSNLGLDTDARRLIDKLDGLPLALATAGAYLRHVPISLGDYLRHYEKSWTRLHADTPSLGSYQDRTLSSTWQISYERVKAQNPLAAQLIRWWAYFDNEDIWFELFQDSRDDDPAWRQELNDELNFNRSMGILHNYGFVEPHSLISDYPESSGYSIHSCLHSWSIHVLNHSWDHELGKLALECVASRVTSRYDDRFWVLQRRLLSHADKSCANIDIRDKDLNWAFYNLGKLYFDQGKMKEAEKLNLWALEGYQKVWGPDYTDTLDAVHNLGLLYTNQGKLQEAEKVYLRALEGYQKAWGPDYASTLETVNNLGSLYSFQGKLQKAEEMYLRALQGKEKALGPDHTSTLDTVNNLGSLYADQGKLQEAEELYLRALKGKEKAYGPDHTSTLETVSNLGALSSKQGKLQKAEKMYLRALKGKERAWGPDHMSTLSTVNNLGNLYAKQGKIQMAKEMYLRAYKGKEKALGPDHTSTLFTIYNLGLLYAKQGKMQKAEEMYLKALQGYEKAVAPEILMTYRPAINVTWNLGRLFRTQSKLVEAKQFCTRALVGLEQCYGTSHPEVLSWREFVGDLGKALSTESLAADSVDRNLSVVRKDDGTSLPSASRKKQRGSLL